MILSHSHLWSLITKNKKLAQQFLHTHSRSTMGGEKRPTSWHTYMLFRHILKLSRKHNIWFLWEVPPISMVHPLLHLLHIVAPLISSMWFIASRCLDGHSYSQKGKEKAREKRTRHERSPKSSDESYKRWRDRKHREKNPYLDKTRKFNYSWFYLSCLFWKCNVFDKHLSHLNDILIAKHI